MRVENLSVGGMRIAVGTWCPGEYGVPNWSLKPIQRRRHVVYGNRDQKRLASGLRYALSDIGVQKAYAPKTFPPSGKIADIRSLTERIFLNSDIEMRRGKNPTDGIPIGVGDGFMASLGGCPFIIGTADRKAVVAHAALKSMIHPDVVMGRKNLEEEPGIVKTIINWFGERGVPAEEVSLCMLLAIPAMAYKRQFDHPTFGAYNTALWELVSRKWPSGATRRGGNMFINLESLFLEQAREGGVRNAETMFSLAEFPDLPHTYNVKWHQDMRYLAVIKRCS